MFKKFFKYQQVNKTKLNEKIKNLVGSEAFIKIISL